MDIIQSVTGSVTKIYNTLTSRKITPEVVIQAKEMISGEAVFNDEGLEDIMKLHEPGVSYAVIAIMGSQSSGKSTLLNYLFHTNFATKDGKSCKKWERMTRGIWISKAPNMDPFTMVMDVEGTDGQQRGKDEAFQKQTTLFSLMVADILIINMKYDDIGRVHGANWPLLETIFEEMLKVFKSRPHKATLQFVIRDHDKETKIGALKNKLNDDVQKIWKDVPKTDEFKNTRLTEIFSVEVDALSHYKLETAHFKEEVVKLSNKIQGFLRVAGDRSGVVPISGFSLHAKTLWETIRQNKNLDLPTQKIMVATVRCEKIAMEKLKQFESDKEWLKSKAATKNGIVPGFGAQISSILRSYLSLYDAESENFEEGVRKSKRQNMETEAFKVVHPAFINILNHLRWNVLKTFENGLEERLMVGRGYAESVHECRESCEQAFDRGCSDAAIEGARWDASFVRQQLVRDMENHALHYVRTNILPQIVEHHRARLSEKVGRHLNRIFNGCNEERISWASIRSFVKKETDSAVSAFCSEVAAYELNQTYLDQRLHDLKQCARNLVVNKFKMETESLLRRMKESYIISLAREEEPFGECLKLLSTMAVIRLDESSRDDDVESLLLSALIDGGDEIPDDDDPLASDTWEEVPPEMTLITPRECRDIWVKLKQEIESKQRQTQSAESEYFEQMSGNSETCEGTESSKIPYWMRLGTWLLGFKDFVSLLWRRDFDGAIKLLFPLIQDAIELEKDCPPSVKEKVKNGCRRMKRKYEQMMKKLKQVLRRFFDFMTAKFTSRDKVSCAI